MNHVEIKWTEKALFESCIIILNTFSCFRINLVSELETKWLAIPRSSIRMSIINKFIEFFSILSISQEIFVEFLLVLEFEAEF